MVDWIDLAEDRNQCWAFVKTVVLFRFNMGKILNRGGNVRLSRRTMLL